MTQTNAIYRGITVTLEETENKTTSNGGPEYSEISIQPFLNGYTDNFIQDNFGAIFTITVPFTLSEKHNFISNERNKLSEAIREYIDTVLDEKKSVPWK